MASLPILHRRRRSKAARTLDSLAQTWLALNIAANGARTAKRGAKVYGAAKGAKVAGKPAYTLAIVPITAGGGLLIWRKVRNNKRAAQAGPSVTPAAHASTVSPPVDQSGALTDPPAGTVNPPVGPRAAT